MRGGAALVLAVLGGLLLAGGTAAPWVAVEGTRQIAGVSVPEVRQTPGLVFAPLAVPLAVLAALASPALAVRAARRVAGAVIASLGVTGMVVVAAGGARAVAGAGHLAAGPAVAAAGAVAIIAAGVLAARRPARLGLPSRYTVEAAQHAEDREWRLASDDEG